MEVLPARISTLPRLWLGPKKKFLEVIRHFLLKYHIEVLPAPDQHLTQIQAPHLMPFSSRDALNVIFWIPLYTAILVLVFRICIGVLHYSMSHPCL